MVNRSPFFPLKLLAVVMNPVFLSILKKPPSFPDDILYCTTLKLPASLSEACNQIDDILHVNIITGSKCALSLSSTVLISWDIKSLTLYDRIV